MINKGDKMNYWGETTGEIEHIVRKAKNYLSQIDTSKPEEAKRRIGELVVWLESWVTEEEE